MLEKAGKVRGILPIVALLAGLASPADEAAPVARTQSFWLHLNSTPVDDATIAIEAKRRAHVVLNAWEGDLLHKLKAANPEVIFVPNYYNEMVQIARQAKQVGIPGSTFVGGDGWDSSNLIEGAGAELEGAYFTNHYAPDVPWPNAKKFLAAFQGKYKHEPTSLSAQGYDAARLLFDAVGRAPELSHEAVRKALAETKDFQGATGTMTMDADRNANKPIVVVQIKAKKFVYSTQVMAQ
jgi:branched-chain amino acid transport system substrate-binding protein